LPSEADRFGAKLPATFGQKTASLGYEKDPKHRRGSRGEQLMASLQLNPNVMKHLLILALALLTLKSNAQYRWDYEVGLRTPPPQGGMFGGAFLNYQVLVKASPRKALGEKGSGRYAFRLRTGPNSISYYGSEPSSSFWFMSSSMFGFERISRPKRNLSSYWGAEVGGVINSYSGTPPQNGNFSAGPAVSILYGVRYRVKPRWTLALELAPSGMIWYSKSNGTWNPPTTQISLNGQTVGLSAVYRL
jgi:hypothetical protein